MLVRCFNVFMSDLKSFRRPISSRTSHIRGLMCFYVLMRVSWVYEVFIWLKMMFLGSMMSFINFRDQNVQERLIRLQVSPWEMHVCVLMVPRMFGRVACNCIVWNWCGRSFTCYFSDWQWKHPCKISQGPHKRSSRRSKG